MSFVAYAEPNAPAGFYVLYTHASGKREVAVGWCFQTREAAERKAVDSGPGFYSARWDGEAWHFPATSETKQVIEPGSR